MSDESEISCRPRSRGQLLADLDSLDVEHRPEWQPGFGGVGFTHCNQAVEEACRKLDVTFPKALKANQQQAWLDSSVGRMAGWQQCSAQRAAERAEGGFPTLGTYFEEPHGHIVVIAPAIDGSGMHCWQAGRTNFSNRPIRSAFTEAQLKTVEYYTHA